MKIDNFMFYPKKLFTAFSHLVSAIKKDFLGVLGGKQSALEREIPFFDLVFGDIAKRIIRNFRCLTDC